MLPLGDRGIGTGAGGKDFYPNYYQDSLLERNLIFFSIQKHSTATHYMQNKLHNFLFSIRNHQHPDSVTI
jgi:hypothetical protein